jgi:iduronate 2-sulfatase
MSSINRPFVVGFTLCLFEVICWSAPLHEKAPPKESSDAKPNILFIISDDLSTALSGYGHPQCKTPNLDKLAKTGVVFERAYCQYPVCGPSRSSFLTGQYPDTLTYGGFREKFPEIVTLPQYFRNNGYYTARISKIYHMGVPPDILKGTAGSDDPLSWDRIFNVKALENKTPGDHEHLSPKFKKSGGSFYTVKGADDDSIYVDGMAKTEALKWLDELKDRTFFLAVGMVRPHVPFVAPKSYFDQYNPQEMKLPVIPDGDLDDVPASALGKHNDKLYGMNLEQQRKALAGYYASVTYMDHLVGEILNKLTQLGLDKNTIIVFTSDHGFNLGEHGCWQKQQLWEDSLRVPLIVCGPGLKKGVRTKKIVELVDLYPSLANLCDLPIPEELVGQSFRPLVDPNSSIQWKDKKYAYSKVKGRSVRTDRWRFNLWRKGEMALYDHHNDPNEFINLAQNPECKNVIIQMKAFLDEATERANFSKKQK